MANKFVLDDVRYDQVRLLHHASELQKFIQQYALKDAQAKGFEEYAKLLTALDNNLAHTIEQVDEYLFKSKRNTGNA